MSKTRNRRSIDKKNYISSKENSRSSKISSLIQTPVSNKLKNFRSTRATTFRKNKNENYSYSGFSFKKKNSYGKINKTRHRLGKRSSQTEIR